MSFKDNHALETLPGQIEKMLATIDKLRAALADFNVHPAGYSLW
jgi:hypothetical protein